MKDKNLDKEVERAIARLEEDLLIDDIMKSTLDDIDNEVEIMEPIEYYFEDKEYFIKYKKWGLLKTMKVKEFLLKELAKWDLEERNVEDAKRIIPRIAEDTNGTDFIFKQLKENGTIDYGDVLNAYNYFVLGD